MSESALIIGSGIAGMCTALALHRRGLRVTVLERDAPPPDGDVDRAFFEWPRRGAAQFRHPHAFLGLMCNLLAEQYPDLLQDFLDAGARRLSFAEMVPPRLQSKYRPQQGDERIWVILCRRATIETVLRRYVERQGIQIINNQHACGIVTEEVNGQLFARGVHIRDRQTRGELTADLLVDATGRASKFPRWFAELGRDVSEEKDDAEIVYYTRHYQLKPGVEEPSRHREDAAAGDLGHLKYGVFPGDNGHFALIVCTHLNELGIREAIKDGDQFDAICRAIPGVEPWIAADKATPTTMPFGIGDICSVWRHYVRDNNPIALNFFAVGDAAVRTNPLYGRGCSTSILHAHLLADVLSDESDPLSRARQFNAVTEERLRPIFKASLEEDRRGIKRAVALQHGQLLDRPESFKQRFGLAFGDALAAAARDNLTVIRGLQRTVNLLEAPGAFLNEWPVKWRLFAYMLRGRKRNAKARHQRGPSRDETYALIEQLQRQAAA